MLPVEVWALLLPGRRSATPAQAWSSRRIQLGDLALLSVATHKISRLLAKDPVTSPLRAPFTRFEGTSGPAELKEDVRGVGARRWVS